MSAESSGGNTPLDYLNSAINGFLRYQEIRNGYDDDDTLVRTPQRAANPNAEIQPLYVSPSNDRAGGVPASPLDLGGKVNMMGMSLPLWLLGLTVIGGVYLMARRGK
jgi:hypothetical protein